MKALVPFKRRPDRGAPFYVRFTVDGKAYLWSTKTDNLPVARKRGADYRDAIIAKRFGLVAGMKQGGSAGRVGDLIECYLNLHSPSWTTRNRNVSSFRELLRVSGLDDNARISQLGSSLISNYQTQFLKARKDASAVVTLNSHVRNARSLFSRQSLKHYKGKPFEVPHETVEALFDVSPLKEPEKAIEIPTEAADKLAHEQLTGEYRRAYLLARYAGLRAGEIAAARRDWLDGDKLRVGGREFVTKSRKYRVITLPSQVTAELLLSDDPVYLVGPNRLVTVYRELPGMLAKMGFPSDKPLHSVRRYFGSILYSTQGPRVARDMLGHFSLSTTEKHYARSLDTPSPVAWVG